jgi:hypothetical protein
MTEEPPPHWKIGDIVNGHLLVSSGWVPLRGAANSGPFWQPGDVVNAHAFTGEEWVPISPPPATTAKPPPSEAARTPLAVPATAASVVQAPARPPGSVQQDRATDDSLRWFQRQSNAMRVAIVVGAIFLIVVISNLTRGAAGPETQSEFIDAVAEGQAAEVDNDTQVVEAKRIRGEAICDLLESNLKVEGWTGTVTRISTGHFNDAGTIEVNVADGVDLITAQSFLDTGDTQIETDSELFDQLAALEEGQLVTFSGEFLSDSDYCLKEDSMGSRNGLRTPDFLMRFKSFQP